MKSIEFYLKTDANSQWNDRLLAQAEMMAQNPVLIEFINKYENGAGIEELTSIYENTLRDDAILDYNKRVIGNPRLQNKIEEKVANALTSLQSNTEKVALGEGADKAANLMRNLLISKKKGEDPGLADQLEEARSNAYLQTAKDLNRNGLNIIINKGAPVTIGRKGITGSDQEILKSLQDELKAVEGWSHLNKAQQEYIMLTCSQSYSAAATYAANTILNHTESANNFIIRGNQNDITIHIKTHDEKAPSVFVQRDLSFSGTLISKETGDAVSLSKDVMSINTKNDISQLKEEQKISPMLFDNKISTKIDMKVTKAGKEFADLASYTKNIPSADIIVHPNILQKFLNSIVNLLKNIKFLFIQEAHVPEIASDHQKNFSQSPIEQKQPGQERAPTHFADDVQAERSHTKNTGRNP